MWAIIYTVGIVLLSHWFTKNSHKIVDKENHKFNFQYENSMIQKSYLLAFINCYLCLFADAFFFQNYKYLTLLLSTVLILKQLGLTAFEWAEPYHEYPHEFSHHKEHMKVHFRKYAENYKQFSDRDLHYNAEKQLLMGDMPKLLVESYKEIIIIFGWLTFFANAFPVGPVLSLLTAQVQVQMELDNIVKFKKRNMPSASLNIGIWQDILEGVSFLSIVVNTGIILFTSKKLATLSDHDYYVLVIAVFVVEHIVFFFKFFLAEIIDDVPDWVRLEEKKMKHRVKQV